MSWRHKLSAAARRQRERIRAALSPVPWWLLVAAGIVAGATPALLVNVTREALPAVLALLGVILGGAIAAGTNFVTAQAARRAQIVGATWPRRVEVHQAGFEMWWRVTGVIYSADDRGPVTMEAQEWWSKNCLYLSEEARTGFKRMISLASSHADLVEAYRGTGDKSGTQAVKESWADIVAVGQALAEGAGTHLSEQVLDELKGKAPSAVKSTVSYTNPHLGF